MFLRTVKMLKATSHAKLEIKTRPGSLLTGRVFIFDFIRRQPYIRRHFSVCEWAWQNSPGACKWAWQFYSALCFRYCTGVMSYAFLNKRLKCSTFS